MRGQEDNAMMSEQLTKLLRLKMYEHPDETRMIGNRQSIMCAVRALQAEKQLAFGERLKKFEPRYVPALIVISLVVGFQYAGLNSRHSILSTGTGIYASLEETTSFEAFSTNSIVYPNLPDHVRLFAPPTGGDGSVLPAQLKIKQ